MQPHVKAGTVPTFSCCTITSSVGARSRPAPSPRNHDWLGSRVETGASSGTSSLPNTRAELLRLSDYFVHEFADLDGDGNLEMVLLLNGKAASGTTPFELRVLSLATGDTRWSHPLNPSAVGSPTYVVGDLDGDRRPEVVVSEQPIVQGLALTEVTALDGVTGKPSLDLARQRRPRSDCTRRWRCIWPTSMVAAGAKSVSVSAWRRNADASRSSTPRGGVEPAVKPSLSICPSSSTLISMATAATSCYSAMRAGCAPSAATSRRFGRGRLANPSAKFYPASPGHAATVILNPSLGLDGATGRPAWSIEDARSFLSSNDGKRLPRVLTGPDGATVCRMPVPVTAEGTYLPAQGLAARPAASRDDPRWERPLPWVGTVEPYADPLVQVTVAATLINVCIPVAIVWLATRRRFWSVRLLLALPVVAAILLTGYSTLSSFILDRPQMTVPRGSGVFLGFVLLSMVGVLIVAYATAFVLSLVRLRWLKWLLALPVVAAILVAGSSVVVCVDSRRTSIG